mmetsp:Transcript_17474/g.42928  ORF Transcript_17474/g.42928 Transcript_17474/m.42928 type:complete len:105 (-) Transcript_17474:1947-2261(-)
MIIPQPRQAKYISSIPACNQQYYKISSILKRRKKRNCTTILGGEGTTQTEKESEPSSDYRQAIVNHDKKRNIWELLKTILPRSSHIKYKRNKYNTVMIQYPTIQ